MTPEPNKSKPLEVSDVLADLEKFFNEHTYAAPNGPPLAPIVKAPPKPRRPSTHSPNGY